MESRRVHSSCPNECTSPEHSSQQKSLRNTSLARSGTALSARLSRASLTWYSCGRRFTMKR
eukprot:1294381-Prymnesium_polylepis.1